MRHVDFSPLYRSTVGFDRLFTMLDSLGQPVFSKQVRISERPHLLGGLASSLFDNDGVATRDRDVVVDGVLQVGDGPLYNVSLVFGSDGLPPPTEPVFSESDI